MIGPTHRQGGDGGNGPQRGSATVELAFSLPILALVLIGTLDFARVFYWDMALTTAVRTGAQYGALSTAQATNTTGIKNAALTAAQTDIPTLALADITATCARQCEPDAPGSATYTLTSPTGGTSCSLSGACAAGNHVIWNVTVTASKQFNTIGHYPGIPSSLSLTRAATMRAQ